MQFKRIFTILIIFFINNVLFFSLNSQIVLKEKSFYIFLNKAHKQKKSGIEINLLKNILEEITVTFNNDELCFNSKIKKVFIKVLEDFDKNMETFQKSIISLDSYLEQYLNNLDPFSLEKEKELLYKIRLFNTLTNELLEKNLFFRVNNEKNIKDFVFFRPLGKHRKLLIGLLTITGIISSYFYLNLRTKKRIKKSFDLNLGDENKNFHIFQIPVNPQKEAECALHALWNALLGTISDSPEVFRKNENKYLKYFYEWAERIRKELSKKNWFDDGELEKIINNRELLPSFTSLEETKKIRILRALPNGAEQFLKMCGGCFGFIGEVDEETYNGAISAELDGSVESFAQGEDQNLILLINRHYIHLKLMRTNRGSNTYNQGNGILVWLTDSLNNTNKYAYREAIKRVLDTYMK